MKKHHNQLGKFPCDHFVEPAESSNEATVRDADGQGPTVSDVQKIADRWATEEVDTYGLPDSEEALAGIMASIYRHAYSMGYHHGRGQVRLSSLERNVAHG